MLEFLTRETLRILLRTRSTSRASNEVTNMPGLKALFRDEYQQDLEALHKEAGLLLTPQEDLSSTHSAMTPQGRYKWNKPLPENLKSLDAPSNDLSLELSAVASALSENVLLSQVFTKINTLAANLAQMKASTKAKDQYLGHTIYNQRLQVHNQAKEISYLKSL